MTGSGRRALEGASLPILGGVGLVLLLCLPVVAVGHGASTPGSPVARSAPTAAVGLCSGASTAGAFVGSLFADSGGTTPPNVGGVGLSLSYWADLNYTPKGGSSTYSCVPESAAVTTNTSGSFYLTAPLPGSGCNGASCSFYSGPYGPLLFSVPAGLPGGYFLTQSVNGNQVGLAFVDALTSTSLVPSSRVTLSANAPTVVHAFPRAGNGAPSPATVGFAWRLEGAGWSVLNGSGNSSVTIEANDRASPGTLTVWVNGSYSGTSLVAPPVTLEIAAATTTTTGGSAYPTSLDVGYPATFSVMGQGAGGYTYTADIFPGLGLPTVVAPCTTSIVAGGLVALTCSTSVTYTTPGLAQPSANLTNGYSTAPFPFLPVTVAPPLGLSISPASALAYVGAIVPVTLTGSAATGTAPQGPACLWPGNGRVFCDAGPGPTFPFSIAYGAPGSYEGKATLGDASQANVSLPFSAQVVERPMLSDLVASTNELGIGENATLVGSLSGGAFPITYWWNSSQPAATLFEGTLTSDGTIAYEFVPRVSGSTVLTLTTLDTLGTRLGVSTRMNVTAGPATDLRVEEATPGPVWAGTATSLAWSAVDPAGEPVASWSAAVSLRVTSGAPPGSPFPEMWVNLSGIPVPPDASGAYAIPASAWSSGTLRCFIDVAGAGDYWVALANGLPLLGGAASTELRVGPDLGAIDLSRPDVVRPGLRSNATLWQISDRFGDAVPGGSIAIDTLAGGTWNNTSSPVLGNASAGTSVWVNYTVPAGLGATVFVLAGPTDELLPPISVPAPSNGAVVSAAWLLVAVGAALAAAAAFGLVSRSRRRYEPEPIAPPGTPASEEELQRWAEGRAHVLLRASSERGQTLDELAQGFVGRPPAPEEMTEWVASLVADGSLRTVLGDDGRSRFVQVAGDDAAPLRVQLDDRALAEALDRRAALDAEERE